MKVDNSEKHVSFSWNGDKSAQIFKTVPKHAKAILIENISTRIVRKINTNHINLTGCAISETGDIFFLQSHQNNLLKYGPNGEFHFKSRIISGQNNNGYCLAMIDSNTVAVSCGGNYPQKIYLIDMNSTETSQVFNLDDYCYGLSYQNGSFLGCTHQNGIKIFDRCQQNFTNGRILRNTPRQVAYTYVTSNDNFIFHSNWYDDSVVCYDCSGQIQWNYSDVLIRKPYGITLDTNSNIYVAGSDSNNIVVISPDGKQSKELIGANDGISSPRAIYFDKTKNLLLVANNNGVAFLYDVS